MEDLSHSVVGLRKEMKDYLDDLEKIVWLFHLFTKKN